MGNCVGVVRKKKKSGSRETSLVELHGQPRVSQWLESSDFSSIPDLEHFGEPAAIMTEEDMCRPSTSQLPVVQDGYSTAPEDLSEEEEEEKNAPEASIADKDSRLSSEYLTSDEQEAVRRADILDKFDDPYWKVLMDTLNKTIEHDSTPITINMDDQPICALPTPLRKNMFSPTIVEALADEKGRVKRKRMTRFLELRQEAIQPV